MKPVLRRIALRCCSFLLLMDAPADTPAIMENCCNESPFFCAQHVSMKYQRCLRPICYMQNICESQAAKIVHLTSETPLAPWDIVTSPDLLTFTFFWHRVQLLVHLFRRETPHH